MPKLTPKQAQEKHNRRLKASLQDIRDGIDRVTESPTEKAAAKQDKMLSRLTASVQSGKWADGLKSVSLSEWKQKFKDKGVGRISAGIDAAAGKTEAFYGQLFPHIESLQTQVKNMPDLTIDDSIERMAVFARGMNKFRFKKS